MLAVVSLDLMLVLSTERLLNLSVRPRLVSPMAADTLYHVDEMFAVYRLCVR